MSFTEAVIHAFENSGFLAVPVSLAMSIIIAVAGILPSFFITGANILFFGPVNGFLISWIGEVAGAAVSFYLYKKSFKRRIDNLKVKNIIIEKIINASGLGAGVLIFQGRLMPFIPSGIITFAAAISNTGFIIFIIASAGGKIPSIFLESLVSYDIINISENRMRLLLTVIALLPLAYTFNRKNKTQN